MNPLLPTQESIDQAAYHAMRDLTARYDANLVDASTFKRWASALTKAALRLHGRGWRWNGTTLVMRSSDDMTQYRVTAGTCECVAFQRGQPCQHRAARRLITSALAIQAAEFESRMEATLPRVTPGEAAIDRLNELALDADMVAAQEKVDELF